MCSNEVNGIDCDFMLTLKKKNHCLDIDPVRSKASLQAVASSLYTPRFHIESSPFIDSIEVVHIDPGDFISIC